MIQGKAMHVGQAENSAVYLNTLEAKHRGTMTVTHFSRTVEHYVKPTHFGPHVAHIQVQV